MTDREAIAVEMAIVARTLFTATPSTERVAFPITRACRVALRANQERRRLLDDQLYVLTTWEHAATLGEA